MRLSSAALALTIGLCGCKGCIDPSASDGNTASLSSSALSPSPLPTASVADPRSPVKTTDGATALRGLGESIRSLEPKAPSSAESLDELVRLLATRYRVTRKPGDLEEMLALTQPPAKGNASADTLPDAARRARARALLAAGRFKEARDALGLAKTDASGAPSADPDLARRTFDGLGDEERAMTAGAHRDFGDGEPATLLIDAIVNGHMGKVDKADHLFELAEHVTTQEAPFGLTEVYFEWASMCEREGDLPRATALYREAHARIPMHVHATVHLAALVTPREAVELLSPLEAPDADPDVLAALAIFRDLVADGTGKASLDEAKKSYAALMAKFPEAYAAHAAWFWLGPGDDTQKALEAARIALVASPTADQLELNLAAAQAAGQRAEACEVAARAKTFLYPTRRLSEALRQVGDCGPKAP